MNATEIIEPTLQVNGKCAACHGAGMVPNPAWEEFRAAVDAGGTNPDSAYSWFEQKGHIVHGTIPREKIFCQECSGSGRRSLSLSLDELKELLR